MIYRQRVKKQNRDIREVILVRKYIQEHLAELEGFHERERKDYELKNSYRL